MKWWRCSRSLSRFSSCKSSLLWTSIECTVLERSATRTSRPRLIKAGRTTVSGLRGLQMCLQHARHPEPAHTCIKARPSCRLPCNRASKTANTDARTFITATWSCRNCSMTHSSSCNSRHQVCQKQGAAQLRPECQHASSNRWPSRQPFEGDRVNALSQSTALVPRILGVRRRFWILQILLQSFLLVKISTVDRRL